MSAALVASAVAGSGCGAPTPARAPVELWALGREGELVAGLVPAFERANPDVAVRVQQIPWSAAHEKLLTAFVGGTLPDVLQVGTTWIPELAALGALAPLDARVARAGTIDPEDYFAGAWDAATVDGVLWAVPWYVDTRVLFARTDLLARAGVVEPPRTLDAWLEAMERVKRVAGPDRYAILLPLSEWEPLVIFAFTLGADLLRDGDRYGNFESAPFRAAFDFYLGLFARGLAPRAGASATANLYRDFADGWFCWFLSGPWNLGELETRLPPALAGDWSPQPVPAADASHPGVSIAGGAALAVAARSPHADAAFRLVAWLSDPARMVAFYRLSGDLPPRRSAWRDPALAGDPRAQVFRAQLEHARPVPQVPEWERIAALLGRYQEMAVRGELAPAAALAALDREADQLLAKRRWMLERSRRAADGSRR
jgi:multiple sugar transport system substrate-binding protein